MQGRQNDFSSSFYGFKSWIKELSLTFRLISIQTLLIININEINNNDIRYQKWS